MRGYSTRGFSTSS